MAAEGHNVDATLLPSSRTDHGHYFQRKTFAKPTYCHHCCDKIWGMLTQGYACEGYWKCDVNALALGYKREDWV